MRRQTILAGAAFAALLALPHGAAAATWAVDKARSRLGFRATQEGTAFDGYFRSWNATISFNPKWLATSKVVVTVATGSAVTGDKDRDAYLPTDDWFGVKRFPTATFTSTRFVDLGGGRYQAVGDLALKGVHRPVVLPFTLAVSGGEAKMAGALTIDRTWFGVGAGRWTDPDEVGTKVTVQVSLTARMAR